MTGLVGGEMEMSRRDKNRIAPIVEIGGLLFLLLYPLRHVAWGGDLWDIGYNYGNFEFGDIQSMGKMWYFSTYLANAAGHVLTLLPWGHTMIGLNVYTGMFASLLALAGYLFCTRKLGIPKVAAFVGEWIALSMCWCPTALLYNYLTYVLFLICVILLYVGLTKGRKWMLVLAGACLGTNVLVRFSNLPEMGLIAAVWAYDIWDVIGEKGGENGWLGLGRCRDSKAVFGRLVRDTLLCLTGYLLALAVFFLPIALFYGMSDYVSGIRLLFAMTETATDYKPTSMLYGLFWPFLESLAWWKKIAVFFVAGILFATCMEYIARRKMDRGDGVGGSFRGYRVLWMIGSLLLTLVFVYWLFLQRKAPVPNFTTFYYTSYDPIFWPGTVFLMIAMGIGAIEVIRKGNAKEDRFLGAVMILILLLTSIGSNNGIYPSLNNLFLAAPYVLWKMGDFTRWSHGRVKRASGIVKGSGRDFTIGLQLNLIPVAVLTWALLVVCVVQFGMFGLLFSFCEGTGQQEKGHFVENNEVLGAVSMSAERAQWLQGLTDYANMARFKGREVILHGNIPAVAFYLQMRPAFHSWNDLASFGADIMEESLKETNSRIWLEMAKSGQIKAEEWPVVIAEKKYASYERESVADDKRDAKWELIQGFMMECVDGLRLQYQKVYENEKFVIWEAVPLAE